MIDVDNIGSWIAAFVLSRSASSVSHQSLVSPMILVSSEVGCSFPIMSKRMSMELPTMNGMKESTLCHEDRQSSSRAVFMMSSRSSQTILLCLVTLVITFDVRANRSIVDERAALMSSMTRANCWAWSTMIIRSCGPDFTGSSRHFVSITRC